MRVEISPRPKWWLNIIRDYEKNYLPGGSEANYPDNETWKIHMKKYYKFILDTENLEFVDFESSKDYTWCMLRWQ